MTTRPARSARPSTCWPPSRPATPRSRGGWSTLLARPRVAARPSPQRCCCVARWPSRRRRTERPGLLLELGIAEITAGQAAGEDHLREALDVSGDDHGVALGATLVLAHALGRAERIEDAVAVVDRAAARLRTADEQTVELLETLALMAGMLDVSTAPVLDARLRALRRRAEEPRCHARGARRGRHARGRVQRGRRGRDRAGAPRAGRQPAARPGADRPAVVRPGDDRARVGRRVRRGDRPDRGRPGREPRHRRQRPLRHEHDLACVAAAAPRRPAGRRRRRAHGARGVRPPGAAALSHRRDRRPRHGADRPGRPRGRRGRAASSFAPGQPARAHSGAMLLLARGRLRAAQRRLDAALADMRAAGDIAVRIGAISPSSLAWRSDAALVSMALGERDRAERLARGELGLARTFAAPRTLGVALRAAGVVVGGAEGEALLREAAMTLDAAGAALESARAVVDLGALLRRSNRRADARELLREGLDIAHRAGAVALADQAETELRATGARPRRARLTGLDALTASERRVAELAAQGMTNREIAQALFVTARTVEGHLTRTFQKLDLHSREDLRGASSRPSEDKRGSAERAGAGKPSSADVPLHARTAPPAPDARSPRPGRGGPLRARPSASSRARARPIGWRSRSARTARWAAASASTSRTRRSSRSRATRTRRSRAGACAPRARPRASSTSTRRASTRSSTAGRTAPSGRSSTSTRRWT